MKPKRVAFLKSWQTHTKELIRSSAKDQLLVEQRQEQIVDGALKLFFEKGYHPTSISEIANSCGMSMGQLYHYISSKDDVLFLVHKRMQIEWHNCLDQSGVDEVEDPVERIRKALFHTLTFLSENSELIRFVYTESKYLNKRHLRVVLKMDDLNVVSYWKRILADVKKKKKIDVNLEFASNLIAYLVAFIPMRGWNLKDRNSKRHLNSLVDFVTKGMGIK